MSVEVFLAVVALSLLVYLCYAYAPKITAAIRPPNRARHSARYCVRAFSVLGCRLRGTAWKRY